MNQELTISPNPSAPHFSPDHSEGPKSKDELQPFFNPRRTALLASASEKLAEAARRIEQLESRLKSLLAQPSESFLS